MSELDSRDIPIGTLRDWEQRRKEPHAAAKAYLRVIAREPDTVRKAGSRSNPVPRIAKHPGEILHKEFLVPRSMSERQLAEAIDLPVKHVREIVSGRQAMTAGTASRLASYFRTTPEFWLNLQAAYDLETDENEEC